MSVITIYRHVCDSCGKTHEESTETGFLPCGGKDGWNAWKFVQKGTGSTQYSTSNGPEFCSYKCAVKWLNNKIENE